MRMYHLWVGIVIRLWGFTALILILGLIAGKGLARGSEIIYTAYTPNVNYLSSEIALLDVEHFISVALTSDRRNSVSATWSPDGQQIAFVSNRAGPPRLYIMDANGHQITSLPTRFGAFGGSAWMPDGQRIIFRSSVRGSPKLALYNLESAESYLLNITGASDSPVIWSPNSQWLIYVSYRDGNPRLYVVSPDCNTDPDGCQYNERLLMDSGYVRWPPTWSPDGRWLVFTGITRRDPELYKVAVNCTTAPSDCIGEVVALTDNDALDYAPAFAPDGHAIAFLSNRDGDTAIYLMNPDTGEAQRLTRRSLNGKTLIWSPDSSQIVLESVEDSRPDLYLVNAVTGEIRRLTTRGNGNTEPAWRPQD